MTLTLLRRAPRSALFLAAMLSALAPSTWAQSASPATTGAATPVVVIVKVAKPWYAPRALVASRMKGTMTQYDHIPGLAHKAYSMARPGGEFGGLYHWKDRASAEAWFDPAWFARVEAERGVRGEVRYFDAPVAVDNTPGDTPAASDSGAVATLVLIATPPGVGRERLVAEFNAAVPAYRRIDGLLRKVFVIGADNTFGGVYLWRDQVAADRWFNAAWHERVKKTYGVDAGIEWFDTPILLPTRVAANRLPLSPP